MPRALWLLLALLPACRLPPRTDDAATPELAFETFRGALAREEFDRAYGLLSDDLRKKIGVKSRAEFMDWGAVAGRKAVRALRRAKAKGPAEVLSGGRAALEVRVSWFVFGRDVTLRFARIPVVRAYIDGTDQPVFYEHAGGLELAQAGGISGVRLPPEAQQDLKEGVAGKRLAAFEARWLWFLDDFEMGDGNE